MKKILIITTFNHKGFLEYGKIMLETCSIYMPSNVDIKVMYEETEENCHFINDRVQFIKFYKNSSALMAFKNKHKHDLRANGKEDRSNDAKKIGIGYRWDAVRFSHKSFAITTAAIKYKNDYDVLIWLDGDINIFEEIPEQFLNDLLPDDNYCSFLGRDKIYTETGFLAFNLKHEYNDLFMKNWEQMYLSGQIFSLNEWHDCEVFDTVRTKLENNNLIKTYNIGKIDGVSNIPHVFINSRLGEYMDHKKGPRKEKGSSHKSDLKIVRNEKYWDNVK